MKLVLITGLLFVSTTAFAGSISDMKQSHQIYAPKSNDVQPSGGQGGNAPVGTPGGGGANMKASPQFYSDANKPSNQRTNPAPKVPTQAYAPHWDGSGESKSQEGAH